MFWDGRADGTVTGDPLADQAQGPPLNPVEMNMPDAAAVVQAVRDASYASLFYQVYGDGSLDDVDTAYKLIATAIAKYERSDEVQKFSSRFDRGELSESELRGKSLFVEKCSVCHIMDDVEQKGPVFTNYGYANIGIPKNPLLPSDVTDLGLGTTVGDSLQDGKFKIPTLRNVGISAPYGHNGYFPTLKDIVNFKIPGSMKAGPLLRWHTTLPRKLAIWQ
jgi:cytochrome c peroxidase